MTNLPDLCRHGHDLSVAGVQKVHHKSGRYEERCRRCVRDSNAAIAARNAGARSHRLELVGDEVARFWRKVDKTDGCWLWTAAISAAGYGVFGMGRIGYAHRVSYFALRGPIPDGMELDHLCRVRNCVNPDHLEPVTHTENMIRTRGHRQAALSAS